MSDPIERLSDVFERFPGIGPRQAQRFVQFILRASPTLRREMIEAIKDLGSSVHQCPVCKRYHSGSAGPCGICANPQRDDTILAVVASDVDLDALERSGVFRGRYFVLGGTISLASESTQGLRVQDLLTLSRAKQTSGLLREIILALPANPEGDATAIRMKEELVETLGDGLRVTQLGRGLSTGSELEYADPDTLRSALESRR